MALQLTEREFREIGNAKRPLVDGLRREMLEAASQGNFHVTLKLPEVIEDMDDAMHDSTSIRKTLETLRKDHRNHWILHQLLHVVPRPLLESVIRSTVAFDKVSGAVASHLRPSGYTGNQVPGVYVLGLRIHRQTLPRSEFLTRLELEKVIQLVRRYGDAVRIMHSKGLGPQNKTKSAMPPPGVWTQAEMDELRFVNGIDTQFGGHRMCRSRWANTLSCEMPDRLATMLEKLCDPNLDPVGNVPMQQSPLYVGCANKLGNRLANYQAGSANLSLVSPALALTMCIIKYIGLTPVITYQIALLTWQKSQLEAAEILMISLARSFIQQSGFNLAQGGGQSGVDCPANAVALWNNNPPVLKENMEASIAEMDKRVLYVHELRKIGKGMYDLNEEVNGPAADQFREALEKFSHNTQKTVLESRIQQMEEANKVLEAKLDVLNALKRLQDALEAAGWGQAAEIPDSGAE